LYPNNFFQNAQNTNFILTSSSKLLNLLTQDLPDSFNWVWSFKENTYFRYNFHLRLLNYSYYLIFIISFICIIYLNRKNILKFITGLIPHNKFNIKPNKLRKEIFILAYPIIFALIYSISVYSIGPSSKNAAYYRYILPIYPFIFIIISLFIVNLFNNKKRIFRYLGILISAIVIIMGIISNINLISFDNWNLGDNSACQSHYSYVFYKSLGEFFGRYFADDISSAISACNKVPSEFKGDCFFGLGEGIGNHHNIDIINISPGISACNKVPTEFRSDCFSGLGLGTSNRSNLDISSTISACNKVLIEFRDNCFRRLG